MRNNEESHIVKIRQEVEDDYWEIVFEVQLKDLTETTVSELHDQLSLVEGIRKVSLLAPQIALPV